MRGLFLKIFTLFWIAQSLIFVISTAVIINRRMPRQDFMVDPAQYEQESVEAVQSYNASGCAGFRGYERGHRAMAGLVDATGSLICEQGILNLPPHATFAEGLRAQQVDNDTLWSIPIAAANGQKLVYAVKVPRRWEPRGWWDSITRFASPQLPVAIAVGGLTTFILVLIFTRPVIRLRRAATQLARGKLNTRIRQTRWGSFFEGEEFNALVLDFNHMAERLQWLVDAQKLLLRDVSHELRSPLARLSLALELARGDADTTMGIHLDRIERETERLNQLIGQLLSLSSMEAAESLEKAQRVSLKQLLDEILIDAEYEAQQRDAGVTLQSVCECEVDGRRELLYRAVENIVRNAIRYTEPGSQVEICLRKDESCRTAVIEVSDRGPGIPESELEAIFRPFYRIDLARAAQTGGFGVGLAIAERAVKLHNGRISASNRAGGGATIQIAIPIAG